MGRPITKVPIPGVDHIIAVASGKGGVGKSTTAVNIAVALAGLNSSEGPRLKVGLLDADVYGPSIPQLMNLHGRPTTGKDRKMMPPESWGVKCMSMGFLMEEDAPAVWRGPMVMSALDSFMTKVSWAPLDILVIDMPPGTGDAQISIGQRLTLSGAVIVSTPQDVALIDARRGANMFRKIKVPLLGIVENMSHYQCPACGHREHIFGHEGALRTAETMKMDVLGQVPLQLAIRETSDAGTPIVAHQPDSPAAQAYQHISSLIYEKLQRTPTQLQPPLLGHASGIVV
ncbi:hypothetical protein WJX79_010711 [Trebouxia sp. C0005]